jgi:redox-sensing transcriptional repressor
VSASGARRRRAPPEPVSELTTNRLSVYLRCLAQLEAAGVRTVSSKAMAEQFRLNAAQIRKDLAYFGEFGTRGVGYQVAALRSHLKEILGVDRTVGVAIIGAGNLGLALADYPGFKLDGFRIVALFDESPQKVGQRSRGGVPIHSMEELPALVKERRIRIAVVAVPAAAAQSVVDTVVRAGVKAILNFSPAAVRAPRDTKIKHVDVTISLESLSFYLARGEDDG